MRRLERFWTMYVLFALATGCAASPGRVAAIEDMERVRAARGVSGDARFASEVYARAEQEREIALRAHESGDDVAAVLHAQRAVAAYDHAFAVARLARAETELGDAKKTLDDATTEEHSLEQSRAKLDADAAELEGRVQATRDRLLPAASAATDGEREAARLVAAGSLAMQAHLLCAAARLVAPTEPSLSDAEGDVAKLDARIAKRARPAPIDDAARGRARCLDILTRARRAAGDDGGPADALLAELSATGGWDPERDERGVVVTLHDAFHGATLASEAVAKLRDLGRVAAAHPALAIQIVVHDAQAGDASVATQRAGAAAQALANGGAPAARTKTELAGTREPVVDPSDLKARGRNERLDVVFVVGK